MILIDGKLVDEALLRTEFACQLSACKGACCVAGESGAPLEVEELPILEQLYPTVAPLLTERGRAAIEAQGTAVRADDGSWETPLMEPHGPCAYTVWGDDGVALCGLEKAYRQGLTEWPKPISCHLYPVRVYQTGQFDLLRYDRWEVCSPACARGTAEGISVIGFVKDALVRRFGLEFYEQLTAVAEQRRAAKAANASLSHTRGDTHQGEAATHRPT